MADSKPTPSLYEWIGGIETLERLLDHFYGSKIPNEPTLAPLFAHISADHFKHVAAFFAEVFGGPADYSKKHGGHPGMIRKHLGKGITESQRRRWMALFIEAADDVGVPDDPEFRAALVGYLEWGSRLAVMNSQPGAQADEHAPMPTWNWGPPGGPWQG